MSGENKQAQDSENLSLAIDALNHNLSFPEQGETRQLMAVARSVKSLGTIELPSEKIIQETVETLAAELAQKRRKRRLLWSFSGAAGTVALAMLVVSLHVNFEPPDKPGSPQPELAGIVQIQPEKTEGSRPMPTDRPEGPAIAPAQSEILKQNVSEAVRAEEPAKSVDRQTASAAKQAGQATAGEQAAKVSAQKSELAIAGLTWKSTETDGVTGVIRKLYSMEDGRQVALVLGEKAAKSQPANSGAPMLKRSIARPEADEAGTATEKPAVKNRVTVTVDGETAIVEGDLTETELAKLAEKVVKQ